MIPLLPTLLTTTTSIAILYILINTTNITLLSPSMPLYQITSFQIKDFTFSIYNLTLSTTILAGVQITNANIIGADLHSTIVDIYYPDWYGNLYQIGVLKETISSDFVDSEGPTIINNNNNNNVCIKDNGLDDDYDTDEEYKEITNVITTKNKKAKITKLDSGNVDNIRIEDDHGICLPSNINTNENKKITTTSTKPFFTIVPKGISISKSDAVSITIRNIPPKIYLNFIKDAIMSKGLMEIYISGVAHVKSPLGIPLSLGILCDNEVHLFDIPIQVVGKNCVVKSVSTGWAGLVELAAEVRDSAMDTFTKRYSILQHDNNNEEEMNEQKGEKDEENENEIEPFLSLSEMILDWHDF